MPAIRLIVNPAAGGGRGGRAIASATAALAAVGSADCRITERAGDEARLVREALADGCDTVVALGGDGTWSKIGAAIVAAGSDCRFVPLAAGRGNDFAKSAGLPAGDYAAMARLIAGGKDRRIDVGMVDEICFLNSAGFGFDAAVCADVARTPWLGGKASYAFSSLRNIAGYRGVRATIGVDGAAYPVPRELLMLVVANGPRFGGTFIIAPAATLTDGRLDLITVGPMGPLGRLLLFAQATRGTHVSAAGVSASQGATFALGFEAPPVFQVDGDVYQARGSTVQVRCVTGALRVLEAAS